MRQSGRTYIARINRIALREVATRGWYLFVRDALEDSEEIRLFCLIATLYDINIATTKNEIVSLKEFCKSRTASYQYQ